MADGSLGAAGMHGPLWAPWPQTPQGGEYGIYAAVMHMSGGPLTFIQIASQ